MMMMMMMTRMIAVLMIVISIGPIGHYVSQPAVIQLPGLEGKQSPKFTRTTNEMWNKVM